MTKGKTVINKIITKALNPVILTPNKTFAKRTLSVTIAIERPKDRAILSITFICLKKIRVQANPGNKNTNMKPIIALIKGTLSRIGRANPNSSLIGDNQSIINDVHYKQGTPFNLMGNSF